LESLHTIVFLHQQAYFWLVDGTSVEALAEYFWLVDGTSVEALAE